LAIESTVRLEDRDRCCIACGVSRNVVVIPVRWGSEHTMEESSFIGYGYALSIKFGKLLSCSSSTLNPGDRCFKDGKRSNATVSKADRVGR
jgi:hypothetical protein